MFVETADAGAVFGFVVGFHDGVCYLHVGKGIEHSDLAGDCVLIVDQRGAVTAKDVGDG